jgi:hypothetical protein
MAIHDDLVQPTAPEPGDGAEEHAPGYGENDGGETDREAHPRAVDHPAELVPEVAVDTHQVLRPRGVTTEHMNAGGLALAHVFLADQHGLRIVGRQQGRGDRQEHHESDQTHPHDAGLAAEQPAQRRLPERGRASQQLFPGLLLGKCLCAALQAC